MFFRPWRRTIPTVRLCASLVNVFCGRYLETEQAFPSIEIEMVVTAVVSGSRMHGILLQANSACSWTTKHNGEAEDLSTCHLLLANSHWVLSTSLNEGQSPMIRRPGGCGCRERFDGALFAFCT